MSITDWLSKDGKSASINVIAGHLAQVMPQ